MTRARSANWTTHTAFMFASQPHDPLARVDRTRLASVRFLDTVVAYELAVHGNAIHYTILADKIRSRYVELAGLGDRAFMLSLARAAGCIRIEPAIYRPQRVSRVGSGPEWDAMLASRHALEEQLERRNAFRQAAEDAGYDPDEEDVDNWDVDDFLFAPPSTIINAVALIELDYQGGPLPD